MTDPENFKWGKYRNSPFFRRGCPEGAGDVSFLSLNFVSLCLNFLTSALSFLSS